jgi:hypothetical protein
VINRYRLIFILALLGLNQAMAAKSCSIVNTSIFEPTTTQLEELQTERLSKKCAQSWIVTTPNRLNSSRI